MVFKSPLTTPIPVVSIPSLVFKTPSEPLPKHPILLSLDNPRCPPVSTEDYRLLSQRLAVGLRNQGLNNGDRVLLACENSIYFPVVFMGTVMAGGIFVGIVKKNQSHDLVLNVKQTSPHVVLLADDSLDRTDDIVNSINYPREKIFHFSDNLDKSGNSDAMRHWSSLLSISDSAKDFQWPIFQSKEEADQTATLMYSSGTSGIPRAVEMTHYQLVAYAIQQGMYQQAKLRPEEIAALSTVPVFGYTAMAQVVGLVNSCITYPLVRAPALVTMKRDFVSIQDMAIKLKMPMLVMYPTFVVTLMKEDDMRKRIPEMKSLRILILLGGPASESLCREFMQLWKTLTGQDLSIRIAYGMTEIGGGNSTRELDAPKRSPSDDLMTNNELKIMDLDGFQEVEEGQEGEIWVRSPSVAKGYWRDPTSTAATFTADGWVRTGDIGLVDSDGAFIAKGRKKDLIKSAHRLVTPLELEEVLLQHPDIKQAVVCTLKDHATQNGQKTRAYIIKREGSTLTADTVIDFLETQAPTLPKLDGGVSFPVTIPIVSNHKPEREVLMAQDPELSH